VQCPLITINIILSRARPLLVMQSQIMKPFCEKYSRSSLVPERLGAPAVSVFCRALPSQSCQSLSYKTTTARARAMTAAGRGPRRRRCGSVSRNRSSLPMASVFSGLVQ
jgi:hypothetical protein